MSFPTSIDTLTTPNAGDPRNSPSLAGILSALNTAVTALETKVGANSSAVAASHDFKLSGVATNDKAASLAGSETLSNKTLTAPKVNVGSDATGDTYYRDSGGLYQRLPAGATNTIYSMSAAGIPEWIANPSASDASTTVKGVSEKATTAEIIAGTATGGTGAPLFICADAVGSPGASKLVQFTPAGKYPAADASLLTNLPSSKLVITTAGVSIDNTEKTLITTTVTGGTLGTGNAIRGRLFLSATSSDNATRQYTFRFKYGGTTLASPTLQANSVSASAGMVVDFILYATGATGTQKISATGFLHNPDNSTYATSNGTSFFVTSGTSSVDSTADQTLAVTCQSDNASASATFDTGYMEKVY